jgi:hypothetical protein
MLRNGHLSSGVQSKYLGIDLVSIWQDQLLPTLNETGNCTAAQKLEVVEAVSLHQRHHKCYARVLINDKFYPFLQAYYNINVQTKSLKKVESHKSRLHVYEC